MLLKPWPRFFFFFFFFLGYKSRRKVYLDLSYAEDRYACASLLSIVLLSIVLVSVNSILNVIMLCVL